MEHLLLRSRQDLSLTLALACFMAGCVSRGDVPGDGGDGGPGDGAAGGEWRPTSTSNAPEPRWGETAVWSGSELLVWGGTADRGEGHFEMLQSGARYDPLTDSWRPISVDGAPSARSGATGVWTGTEMIVWGGSLGTCEPCQSQMYQDGGRYDPVADQWSPVPSAGAPEARVSAGGAWTGTEMLIYGGLVYPETEAGSPRLAVGGGAFSPETEVWRAIASEGSPAVDREPFVAWTGTELIVWDGRRLDPPRQGGRYDPATDTWSPMPPQEDDQRAVGVAWAEDRLVAIHTEGDAYSTYEPSSDRWESHPSDLGLRCHTPVWSGHELLLWSPPDATARLEPGTGTSWAMTREGEPLARYNQVAVWTGSEMIVWGGQIAAPPDRTDTGGLYRPAP